MINQETKMKVPGPELGLIEILDFYTTELAKKESSQRQRTSNPLRPSSAGKCARELAFEYMIYLGDLEVPPVIEPPPVQRLLKLGHSLEYHMVSEFRKAFKEAGGQVSIKYGQQVVRIMPMQNGGFLEGQIDGLFYAPDWRLLIDYKTKKDKFSSFYSTNWEEDHAWLQESFHQISENSFYIEDLSAFVKKYRQSKPFLCYNFYQLNLYFHEKSDFFAEAGVDACSLIYYNKNDSRMREIRFKPSREVYEETVNRMKTAEKAGLEKDIELAPREFTLGTIKCAFCNFQEMCWGLDAKKEWYKTFPKKSWPIDSNRLPPELESMYSEYLKLETAEEDKKALEFAMISLMETNRCWKVKFKDGRVYQIKDFKTGGVANGPRKALRRTKV